MDLHEARGLPRFTLHDGRFQRYDSHEGLQRYDSQEGNPPIALKQAELPDGTILQRLPDMYANRTGASRHSRSLRIISSLKALTIKHSARGLFLQAQGSRLSPTPSPSTSTHSTIARLPRPMLTTDRHVNPRANSNNVSNIKGCNGPLMLDPHVDVSPKSSIFDCDSWVGLRHGAALQMYESARL
jgi:hypothetical protein